MTQKILTRNFILAFFAQFAFTSVFHSLVPTLPIYLSGLGSTEDEIGVLIGVFFFSSLVLRLFQGMGFAFFQTASMTLIANISPEDHRGQSLSYFYLAINLSGALGPSLGMFLINHFSFTLLFLVCLGLSLCSLLIADQLGRRQVAPLQDSSIEDG